MTKILQRNLLNYTNKTVFELISAFYGDFEENDVKKTLIKSMFRIFPQEE